MGYLTSCTNCDYQGSFSFGPMRWELKINEQTEDELGLYGSTTHHFWCDTCDSFESVVEGVVDIPYEQKSKTKELAEWEAKKENGTGDFIENKFTIIGLKNELLAIAEKISRSKLFWEAQKIVPHCTKCGNTTSKPLKFANPMNIGSRGKTNITHQCGGTIVYREGLRMYYGSRVPVTYYDATGKIVGTGIRNLNDL